MMRDEQQRRSAPGQLRDLRLEQGAEARVKPVPDLIEDEQLRWTDEAARDQNLPSLAERKLHEGPFAQLPEGQLVDQGCGACPLRRIGFMEEANARGEAGEDDFFDGVVDVKSNLPLL